ncbi:hypothetical protein CU103_28135 [Phyllobacterium sophorae]|uniref:Activator of Hsp90 ATPase homologue 1/2-like C-terminal domain-containing protein n=1 Tax=Phyllobacterium sophorae TaxID=1520277 RepID=A0A2P7AT83_9HYPH|nr:hypothetical protein CU103_28135 [Phyllobacterium sophorae]
MSTDYYFGRNLIALAGSDWAPLGLWTHNQTIPLPRGDGRQENYRRPPHRRLEFSPPSVRPLACRSHEGETIIVRRDFTHPPARLWPALTEPALIPQWMGTMKRCEVDLRPGGALHYE